MSEAGSLRAPLLAPVDLVAFCVCLSLAIHGVTRCLLYHRMHALHVCCRIFRALLPVACVLWKRHVAPSWPLAREQGRAANAACALHALRRNGNLESASSDLELGLTVFFKASQKHTWLGVESKMVRGVECYCGCMCQQWDACCFEPFNSESLSRPDAAAGHHAD